MSDPFKGKHGENGDPPSLELEFSNRVAGNLEHKSGLLAAILGEDDCPETDSQAAPTAEQVDGGPKVVPFPAARRPK